MLLFGRRDKRLVVQEIPGQSPQHLARYIYQSGHFSPANRRVKPNAFLPDPRQLKISSAITDSLDEPGIGAVGDVLGGLRRVPTLPIARADFESAALRTVKLEIEKDPLPHPRHVNLCGWPVEKMPKKRSL